MKYGQIAGAKRINEFIYHCFEHVSEADELKFVKKFREQPHDSDQVMHTFRELVLGAYLGSCGLRARHECTIDGRTPDWCIFEKTGEVVGIVEVASFHLDKTIENEVKEQINARNRAVFWRDANKDNVARLYYAIWGKMQVYRTLAERQGLAFVVAVFGEFEAAVDFKEELCPCLFDEVFGLFHTNPETSGVLYFEEYSGQYLFNYARNPNALHLTDLPSGVFPHDGV